MVNTNNKNNFYTIGLAIWSVSNNNEGAILFKLPI